MAADKPCPQLQPSLIGLVLHKTYLTIAFSQEIFSALVSDNVEDNNSVVKIKDLILSRCNLELN